MGLSSLLSLLKRGFSSISFALSLALATPLLILCTQSPFSTLQHIATYCNILQHAVTHCNMALLQTSPTKTGLFPKRGQRLQCTWNNAREFVYDVECRGARSSSSLALNPCPCLQSSGFTCASGSGSMPHHLKPFEHTSITRSRVLQVRVPFCMSSVHDFGAISTR